MSTCRDVMRWFLTTLSAAEIVIPELISKNDNVCFLGGGGDYNFSGGGGQDCHFLGLLGRLLASMQFGSGLLVPCASSILIR